MLLKIDLPNSYESAIVKTEVTNQEYTTYLTIRDVNLTQQETINIQNKGLAEIMVINANASSQATMKLNQGDGKVAKQNIEYTTLGLKSVQGNLTFADPQNDLMTYYMYQRISGLNETTNNKLLVGMNDTTSLMGQAGFG